MPEHLDIHFFGKVVVAETAEALDPRLVWKLQVVVDFRVDLEQIAVVAAIDADSLAAAVHFGKETKKILPERIAGPRVGCDPVDVRRAASGNSR